MLLGGGGELWGAEGVEPSHWDIPTWISEEKEIWESNSPIDTRNDPIAKEKGCENSKMPQDVSYPLRPAGGSRGRRGGFSGPEKGCCCSIFRFTSFLGQLYHTRQERRHGIIGSSLFWGFSTDIWMRTLREELKAAILGAELGRVGSPRPGCLGSNPRWMGY